MLVYLSNALSTSTFILVNGNKWNGVSTPRNSYIVGVSKTIKVTFIVNSKISKGEVKLPRKLYLKLIESSVRPSLNLGASSRK